MKIINLILFIGVLLNHCQSNEENLKSIKKIIRPVKLFEIKKHSINEVFEFPGFIKPSKETILSFQTHGKIQVMKGNEGDYFKKGQIIASLDKRESRFITDELKARYKDSQLDLQRAKNLYSKKVSPKRNLDKAITASDILMSQINRAKKALEDTDLIAPFDGVITKKYVDEFQEPEQMNKKVLLFQDISNLEVQIDLPQKLMFKKDSFNKIQFKALFEELPNQEFLLKFKKFEPQPDLDTLTYPVIFAMKNIKNNLILPGMTPTVKAYFPLDIPDGFLIPASSVFISSDNKMKVWIFKNNQVNSRIIETSTPIGENVLITKGLKEGEKIVSAGVRSLIENMSVSIYSEVLK
jgi:RND family efflux transporter MFP subunit